MKAETRRPFFVLGVWLKRGILYLQITNTHSILEQGLLADLIIIHLTAHARSEVVHRAD
jgi:hypothetical protein